MLVLLAQMVQPPVSVAVVAVIAVVADVAVVAVVAVAAAVCYLLLEFYEMWIF